MRVLWSSSEPGMGRPESWRGVGTARWGAVGVGLADILVALTGPACQRYYPTLCIGRDNVTRGAITASSWPITRY
jgi:hypothetical protein